MFEIYIKIGISVYFLLGLTFVLANFILDDEFLEYRKTISNIIEFIGYLLLSILFFPFFILCEESVFSLNEDGNLEHREFISVWLNLILICTVYVLLKMYVL